MAIKRLLPLILAAALLLAACSGTAQSAPESDGNRKQLLSLEETQELSERYVDLAELLGFTPFEDVSQLPQDLMLTYAFSHPEEEAGYFDEETTYLQVSEKEIQRRIEKYFGLTGFAPQQGSDFYDAEKKLYSVQAGSLNGDILLKPLTAFRQGDTLQLTVAVYPDVGEQPDHISEYTLTRQEDGYAFVSMRHLPMDG